MPGKTVNNLKKDKPFRPADLIVYAVLAAVIAALFITFVFVRPSAPVTTVYAECDGDRVFSYSFSGGELTVSAQFVDRIETKEYPEKYSVTFYADEEKKDYNIIIIEKTGKVFVSDANCSARRDCALMSAITDESGIIVCVPHKLKLYASGEMNPSLGQN